MRDTPRALCLVLLILSGCADPFALREGEPPEEIPDWWLNPDSPQAVLSNLMQIYANEVPSLIDRLLADDFRFELDPADVSGNSDGELSRDQEEQFTRTLLDGLGTPPVLSLIESAGNPDPGTPGTEVILYRDYLLLVDDPFAVNSNESLQAEGVAIFTLFQGFSATDWRIVHWKDESAGEDWSWGKLKLELVGDD